MSLIYLSNSCAVSEMCYRFSNYFWVREYIVLPTDRSSTAVLAKLAIHQRDYLCEQCLKAGVGNGA